MKRTFDQTKLCAEDYTALFEAVQRVAYKNVEYAFFVPSVFRKARCIERVTAQIGTTGKVDITSEWSEGLLGKLGLGEDISITVSDPTAIVPELRIGYKAVHPFLILGFGPGNQYDAAVDFRTGDAMFNEADQDLAHRLGFVYTPKGMIDMFFLAASSPETHRKKKQTDETGNPILYCDNLACQREIRNPVLVMDHTTGGIYHSKICEVRDAQAKQDRGVKGFSPEYVALEAVRQLYKEGKIQQAPGFQAA